ncbi:hypothetical protein ES319_A08G203700v1 [Gossypium barbadense]|uniref:Response regulatory domain-containing protein n=2 Tax=Gossypium TaxID=3633 RepID=A0A5J5UUD6_GOSBA|nr:hypothetical protein ES319_A08G203700v1 [Gossypium barbadense]TYH07334.1 hypothetical protein ES288_A08G225700v1 [Gossypium darwinii]
MAQSKHGGRKLGQSNKMTALVVDDNMINRTIHHRLLDNLGIENEVVSNGKEAVDIHYSGKMFDLVLMDMDMPIMNGIELGFHLECVRLRRSFVKWEFEA